MSWDSWVEAYRLHARSRRFHAKVDRVLALIRETPQRVHGELFCSLSGGKDSAAMAGLIKEAGFPDTRLVHATCAFNFPDTMATVEALADTLDMDLDIVEPGELDDHFKRIAKHFGVPAVRRPLSGFTELDLLRAIPADIDITDHLDHVHRAVAAGNMLVSHTYEMGYSGSFVGLRGDESKGREIYKNTRGPFHRSVLDDKWQICPLLLWTGQDVMAYCVHRGLPLHPFYRRAYERMRDESKAPHEHRVDLTIVGGGIASRGGFATLKSVYPAEVAKLIRSRPELSRYC